MVIQDHGDLSSSFQLCSVIQKTVLAFFYTQYSIIYFHSCQSKVRDSADTVYRLVAMVMNSLSDLGPYELCPPPPPITWEQTPLRPLFSRISPTQSANNRANLKWGTSLSDSNFSRFFILSPCKRPLTSFTILLSSGQSSTNPNLFEI